MTLEQMLGQYNFYIDEKLKAKTTWGRNEIKRLMRQAGIEVAEQIMADEPFGSPPPSSDIALLNPCPPTGVPSA